MSRIFAPFSFEGITSSPPTTTFSGHLELQVGDRPVTLLEVGPAHTGGDVIVHLPDSGVVFTGDILFHRAHPIVWAGPVSNWIAACDRILELRPTVVVPGHGPLATPSAIVDLKAYFEHLSAEAEARYVQGMSALDAAKDIDLSDYADWGEPERVVANIHALYGDFGAGSRPDLLSVLGEMASLAGQPGEVPPPA
jgi:glyoxylase-like metal-dependent hydrolase (beta-lactamase superfamily II)